MRSSKSNPNFNTRYRARKWGTWPGCEIQHARVPTFDSLCVFLGMSTSRVLQHLYSLDTASSPDLLRYLDYLIQSDDEERYLSSLQGSELTRLVDFLDSVRPSLPVSFQLTSRTPQVLDSVTITDDVSVRCLHKLQAICGHHEILPSSYNFSGDLTRVDSHPIYSGGFSDTWEGIHDGKMVCIERLMITKQTCQDVEKVCMCCW